MGTTPCPGTQGSCGRFRAKPQLCRWVVGFPRRADRPSELEAWPHIGGDTSPSTGSTGLPSLGVATSGDGYGPFCLVFPPFSVSLGLGLQGAAGAEFSWTGIQRVPLRGAWPKGDVWGTWQEENPEIPGEDSPAEEWTPCLEGLRAARQWVLLEGGLDAPHKLRPEESRQNAG